MSAIHSFARKIRDSRSLYLQLSFATLAFILMVITSTLFVRNMLVRYLKRDAVNILMQTRIRIMDELLEPETLMISIVKDVRGIIMGGGEAADVRKYFDGISSELKKKEKGFIFDGLHGYFEALGGVYIPAPGWVVTDDYSATERPWYKAAVEANGKIIITPIYLSLRSREYQINVASRIFDDKGKPLGVVTMNVPLHNMTKFIADMRLVEGGYGFLANENFELVAHHEAEFVTMHMNEIGPGFRRIVEMMQKGETFSKVEGDNYQGINSIFYCELLDNGWYLGIVTPESVYYKDLRLLTLFLCAIGFILIIVTNIMLIRIDAAKSKSDELLREQHVRLALAEEARAMDERVQLMFDAAPFGITLVDKSYNIIDCNQATLLMVGISDKDEYLTEFLRFSPEYQQNGERSDILMRQYMDQVFENHGGRFSWTHQTLSGEEIPCEITFAHSTYRGQEVAIGYMRDLRKERELERTNEEKNTLANIKNILDGLDTMIYVTDPATDQILFINNYMKLHAGIEHDIIGQICYKVFQKDVNKKCDHCPCFQLDKEPGATIAWENRNTLTGRVYRNVDRYIDWPNGKMVHLGHAIDINDYKTMTDALDKRLEQQSLMAYISQSFLSTKDMDVLITELLRMVGEFMGIDQALMLVAEDDGVSLTCRNAWMNPVLELPTRVGVTLSINKHVLDIIQRVKEQGDFYVTSDDPEVREAVGPLRFDFYNYLLSFVFLDGKLHAIIDFSMKDENIQWDQDKINLASYVTNLLVGALNKRMMEIHLITAKEAAEQSNRSKGIFLANMSHEIRTPMNAILGISEIQLQGDALAPDAEEAFRQIYDSGNLLLNIINDILDFSKIEAGKLEIVPAEYDVPSLINDTVQLNHLRYESKLIEFRLIVDENTPSRLYGDELRIKQILNNLLSNAFKYTDKGVIELSVHGESDENSENVTLVFLVCDTGQGMNEDQIERLFDEYSRFNMKTNRGVSGTGLGMSITKRLIDMMDGEIFVESKPGEGSIFAVRLPQKRVSADVFGAKLANSLQNFSFRSTPISKKARIVHEYMPYGSVLVVDDVKSNLYVARGLLTPYGLRIETAESGLDAVEKIKEGAVYDIVFMDHMMPVMDGIEALKAIRDMGYKHPVVAMTANAVVGQSDMFLANGFDGFISKPVDSRELDAMLDHLIRDKQPPEVIEATLREQREREAEKSAGFVQDINGTPEIEKYFISDAEKTIAAIEEVYARLGDSNADAEAVNAYITAVHGIKSALANIGERELSAAALHLEQAGNNRNFAMITSETPGFIDGLRLLIAKYNPASDGGDVEASEDDAAYLRDRLSYIKNACDTFDIIAAKDALDDLRQKTWPSRVSEILDEISAHLLHSAFKKAASVAEDALKT